MQDTNNKKQVQSPEETIAERTVRHYDVDALKKDIARHKLNIEVFTKAIKDAKKQIAELEGYIKTIEGAKDGNHICSST